MQAKRSTPTAANSNEKKDAVRRLLQESGEVAPIDFQKYAKRASEVITRAAEKARGRAAQKVRR